jgi:hypothetical protein
MRLDDVEVELKIKVEATKKMKQRKDQNLPPMSPGGLSRRAIISSSNYVEK